MKKRVHLDEPILLSSVLDDLLSRLGLKTILEEHSALHLWYEVIDEKFRDKTRPIKVEDGILFVKVSSPALRNRLSFERERFVELINKLAGKNIIKAIKLS